MEKHKQEDKEDIFKLKMAIIYGKNLVDGENKDGSMEKIYKDEEDTAHCFYLKDFLKENLKNEVDLQASVQTRDSNSIFYEIQRLGHIGFAESTSKKSDREGIFYIPKSITEKQKNTLKQFAKQLEEQDYNIMLFMNLFRDNDGIIMGSVKRGKANILNSITKEDIER